MKDQKYINILVRQFSVKELSDPHGEAIKVAQERKEYEKTHPDLDIQENIMEARVRYRGERVRKYFKEELQPFGGDPDLIPDIPVLPVPWLKENVWPYLIGAGAIRKEDLKPGQKYLGSCRNATEATWDGEKFWYTRHKFGTTYQEGISHFQDDTGNDVFIPIKEI